MRNILSRINPLGLLKSRNSVENELGEYPSITYLFNPLLVKQMKIRYRQLAAQETFLSFDQVMAQVEQDIEYLKKQIEEEKMYECLKVD